MSVAYEINSEVKDTYGAHDTASLWMPTPVVSPAAIPHPKTRHINFYVPYRREGWSVSRIRKTMLGGFYLRHLKHIGFIRKFVLWLWGIITPIVVYSSLTYVYGLRSLRSRPLVPMQALHSGGSQSYQLRAPEGVETPKPRVFPVCDAHWLVSPHDRYVFPEIYVDTLSHVLVHGGTNLIINGENVVCHDMYDFVRDYTSEELKYRTRVLPENQTVRWLMYDIHPVKIPVAGTFVDACASNYAHWLTEVLPRIILFCSDSKFDGIPIIVNEGLHPNIMESLFCVVGESREIIELADGRALEVEKLYLMSVAGYVPFERRDPELQGHSHGKFSPYALSLIQSRMKDQAKYLDNAEWPDKIFIRRNLPQRQIVNVSEIEQLAVKHGYVVVDPGRLSFLEQVKLFSRAKAIAGSSGAALAGLIFAPSEVNITIMIGKNHITSYWYWQNIACASGKKVNYVLGDACGSYCKSIHSDFRINPADFLDAIGGKA